MRETFQDRLQVGGDGHRLVDRHTRTAGVADRVAADRRAEAGHGKAHELSEQLAYVLSAHRENEHRPMDAGVEPGGRLRQDVRAFEVEPRGRVVASGLCGAGTRELGANVGSEDETSLGHGYNVEPVWRADLNEAVTIVMETA